MKKLLILSLLLISTQFSNSLQAQYGFYNKFYTAILGAGQQHDYTKFNGINLNLWSHYPICNEQERDYGWIDWVATDILNADISLYGTQIQNLVSSN